MSGKCFKNVLNNDIFGINWDRNLKCTIKLAFSHHPPHSNINRKTSHNLNVALRVATELILYKKKHSPTHFLLKGFNNKNLNSLKSRYH